MKVELVVGVAGSGKTTYCQQFSDDENFKFFHDEWVDEQYADAGVIRDMRDMFYPHLNFETVGKKNIGELLSQNGAYNVLLKGYFKQRFMRSLIFWVNQGSGGIRQQRVIVECPFIDDCIEALKELVGDRLTITLIEVSHETMMSRLRARGWDDARINMSIYPQIEEIGKFEHIIDKKVSGEE